MAATTAPTKCAYVLVLLMTPYAWLINQITFTSGDYGFVVIQSVVCALLSEILIVWLWRRAPTFAKVLLVVCAVVNAVTLMDAGGRRLPAVMGW